MNNPNGTTRTVIRIAIGALCTAALAMSGYVQSQNNAAHDSLMKAIQTLADRERIHDALPAHAAGSVRFEFLGRSMTRVESKIDAMLERIPKPK